MEKNFDLWIYPHPILKKIIIELKIAFLIILVSGSNLLATNSYSQVTRVSLAMESKSLEQIMDEIELQSEFYFIFNQKQVDVNRVVDIQANDKLITDILPEIFKGTNVNYAVFDRKILLTTDSIMNVLTESALSTKPQQQTVTGKVTDSETGEAMPGVNILVTGTNVGTITDISGNYSLDVPSGNVTLQFSFIGYVIQEIALNGRTTLDVALLSDVAQLQEVVVIGYGSVKKSDLTGSVSSVQLEDLVQQPMFDIGSALQGKSSGLIINENASGSPGREVLIRIRGINSISTNNDPLIIVDGVQGTENALLNLPPQDIKSIDILKDASATAIYGSRGSNGVILITTKSGEGMREGQVEVNYSHSSTFNVMNRHRPNVNSEQLSYIYVQSNINAPKYGGKLTGIDFSKIGHLYEQVTPHSYIVDLVGSDGNYYAPRFDTNWEEEVYHPSYSHNDFITVQGRNANAQFNISLGTSKDNGLMKKTFASNDYAKISTRLEDIFERLDIYANLRINRFRKSNIDEANIAARAGHHRPSLPAYKYPDDPEVYGEYAGRWSYDWILGNNFATPNFIIDQEDGYVNNTQVTGISGFTLKFSDQLTLESSLGIDMSFPKTTHYSGKYFDSAGNASIQSNRNFYWQNTNYLTYNNKFGLHDVNVMVGAEWSKSSYETAYIYNSYFFDNFYKWHNIEVGTATQPTVRSSDGASTLNSYFARVNYGFAGRYLLTLTTRVDGSSKFGANYKYAFFPSASFAWRVTEEEFFNVDAISNLKLRLSWGQTGNEKIGNYETQQYLSATNVLIGPGSSTYTALIPSSVGNANLKWETTTGTNIGLDLGLWKNTINLGFDYYYKKTTDMLLNVQTPESTTVGEVRRNYGAMKNEGVEVSLRTYNIKGGDFLWNTNVVFTRNHNEILKLGPTGADIFNTVGAGRAPEVWREGEPIGSFFGLVRLGTYKVEEVRLAAQYGLKPGDLKFQDTNGDGSISILDDGVIIGNAWPDWEADVINNFTYKNWSASVDIRIVMGYDKFTTLERTEDRQLVSGARPSVLQAWRPDNQNSMVAQLRNGYKGAYYQSYADSHSVTDGSHIRGQGATLSYTLDKSVLSSIGLENSTARIYVSARNYFVYCFHETGYIDYDPEGSSLGGNEQRPLIPNINKFQYPRPTELSIGIDVRF